MRTGTQPMAESVWQGGGMSPTSLYSGMNDIHAEQPIKHSPNSFEQRPEVILMQVTKMS